jgi:putative ABC transport system permease protein
MWSIKSIIRSILKDKKYVLLNILGLGLGLAAFFFIFLWIHHQLSFDAFHKNYSNIYQINYQSTKDGGRWAGSPAPLAPAIRESVSGIEAAARIRPCPDFAFQYGDIMLYEENGMITDPAFFDIFSFEAIQGDPQKALENLNYIVITESFAKRYFGDNDPIDKKLMLEAEGLVTVKAVIKDIPSNSHIQFDYLLSFKFAEHYRLCGMYWGDPNFRTFILTTSGVAIKDVTASIEQIARDNNNPHIISGDNVYNLRSLKDIYLDYEISNRLGESGDVRALYVFGSIGILVLLLACVNYMNLSLSLFNKKSTSASIKKLIGAERSTIFNAYIVETSLIILFSFLLAFMLISSLRPLFINLIDQNIPFALQSKHIVFIGAVFLVTTIFCGIYPALQLSSVRATHLWSSKKRKNKMMRVLLVLQNSISISLIICTLLIARQLNYMQHKDLGFSKNQTAYIFLRGKINQTIDILKEQMLQYPDVQKIAFKDCLPHGIRNGTVGIQWKIDGQVFAGDKERIGMETTRIDYSYFDLVDVKFANGRNFDPNLTTDVQHYILNEEAVRQIGMTNPIGSEFARYGEWGKIIGVIKDTHFKSLHEKINPQVYHLFKDLKTESYFSVMFFKLSGNNTPDFIDKLGSAWAELNPGIPFEYHFLDEDYESIYKKDRRTAQMLSVFTVLAIFIACLGLIGQSQIAADTRTKEIGIRKVNGASSRSILYLLNRDFLAWIIVAFVIACPAAYFGMQMWLRNFAYHTEMRVGLFLASGFIAIIISLGTISLQVFKAARTNPVEALRYE